RPYFSMKLIQGRTLAGLLAARTEQRDLPRFLGIFAQVCQTLAYAHSRGVIHRDVKPGNVMVGEFGEVQLMDWGIAKVLDPDRRERQRPEPAGPARPASARDTADCASPSAQTQAGTVVGTFAYM